MISLSKQQMLEIWRKRLGLQPRMADCSVAAFEGIDLDDLIAARMREWYLGLLDNAPAHLIPTADIASDVAIRLDDSPLWLTVSLPDSIRRPLSVKLKGWMVSVPVLSVEEAATTVARMASPYARPGVYAPLAVISPMGLRVTPAAGLVEELIAVSDSGPESYILDESLLSTIPND